VSREERRRHLAVYPGSFDTPTNGHLDIARRAAYLFDTLIVAVYAVPAKHLLFSLEERVQLWQEVLVAEALPNVHVEPYAELSIDYVRSVGGDVTDWLPTPVIRALQRKFEEECGSPPLFCQ
jgi:pantetheine-phosphate adenylyltransferase